MKRAISGAQPSIHFVSTYEPYGTMLGNLPHITNLAQVIQLAVAPVFLLAGVGTILNAMATRVGRIIDRARSMEDRLFTAPPDQVDGIHQLLRVLSKRATLINRAIGLSVVCGILVSLVVAALFVSSFLSMDLAVPIAIAFVIALLCFAAALVYFLREVILATNSLSFGGVRPTPPVAKE